MFMAIISSQHQKFPEGRPGMSDETSCLESQGCPPAELGNSIASYKPTADSDSSGMDSSGNDETREQRDFQLESQA